jgi:hypothetical protein
VILDATVNNREKDGIEYVSLCPSLVFDTLELMLMIVNGSIAALSLIRGLGVGFLGQSEVGQTVYCFRHWR